MYYHCLACDNEIDLPDYSADGGEFLICTMPRCGKMAVVVVEEEPV